MALEIELKLRLENLNSIQNLFQDLSIIHPRTFEDNFLLDQRGKLKKDGFALRLRQYGEHFSMTFKGKLQKTDGIQSREEFETTIGNLEQAFKIYEALGFQVAFRYQKYRTIWRFDPETLLMLDETPIGSFLEIEGPPHKIQNVLQRFNLKNLEKICAPYPVLYSNQYATAEKPNMIF